jgi:NAD(P)-dependent dehydrogenase (short-subunit alcohol dehydrogenase family)
MQSMPGTSNVKFDFSGKTAIVTGATKGIGRDIALALAAAGCKVGITGRSAPELEGLAAEILAAGGQCCSFTADLAVAGECAAMAGHFCALLGRVDILVNNAGISFPEELVELDIEHWNTTINVNLRAPMIASKIVAKAMIAAGSGAIVNISSNACVGGIAEHAAYCASKFGLDGLTKVMAVELGPRGIRVNAVAPTVVLTPMGTQVWGDADKAAPVLRKIPMGRFCVPSEVTQAVLFLASDAASMIHGETILIDGGANAKLY